MGKKAIITGISGQDGSYLAELLLEKGYEVHGIVRRSAIEDPENKLSRIQTIIKDIKLHIGTLESFPSIFRVLREIEPDECYHLAAQSFVNYSFDDEFSTMNANISSTHYMLAAIKDCVPDCRFYFAASSEMFGNVKVSPQNENSVFCPRSYYGISKVTGYHLTRNYREVYGLKASVGILYNHESPRRGYEFVTRKITSYAARIKLGLANKITLGNLDAKRDWGYAKEYVKAMWLMLQQDEPSDYVIATGRTHSVREFLEKTFRYLGMDYRDYVEVNAQFVRPAESGLLVGDYSKAQRDLGWKPEYTLENLIQIMIDEDLRLLKNKI